MNLLINNWRESLLSSLFCIIAVSAWGQDLKWLDPVEENALSGRVPQMEQGDGYSRLPLALEDRVRDPVWRLGKDAAGVYIDFTTDSKNVRVQYQVTGNLNMPHMPSTGVSGLDLYAKDTNSAQWRWIHGRYKFADTVEYVFGDFAAESAGGQYRLYLPLYNAVEWMKIGIDDDSQIEFLRGDNKPIVVYGTSIAQGACASRPGLAWTNWLGRSTDRELINLGFSGNGRLEDEILDLIKDIDAAAFILDCIPNLSVQGEDGAEKLANLIENAVRTLRAEHPNTPIIFAAHSSSAVQGVLNLKMNADFDARSNVAAQTVEGLQKRGDQHVFWLSSQELGLDINSTVDYAHPNDYGMEKIASAYQRLLEKLKIVQP